MCGDSTCTHNNTFVACAICKELIQIKDTHVLEGMSLNLNKKAYDKMTFRVCNKCKNRLLEENTSNN